MDHPSECVSAAAARWPMVVLRGVVGVAFGATVVLMADIGLGLLAFLWGTYVVVDGVLAAMVASVGDGGRRRWGWLFFEGVLGIAAGAVAFAWSGATALGLLVTIAVRTAFSGLAEVREASLLRRLIADEMLLGTSGVLSISVGLLMLMMYPGASALAVVWLIGAHGLAFGALQFALGVRLNRWHREWERKGFHGRPTHA